MSGGETIREQRLRMRRTRLRVRLETYGAVRGLKPGWVVAPTRIAHLMENGRPVCGMRWINDGNPPPAPLSECRTCTLRERREDWSKFDA